MADKYRSFGVMENTRLLAAAGLMPYGVGSAELAYWVRPESRGRGLAVAALNHLTKWADDNGYRNLWLKSAWTTRRPNA